MDKNLERTNELLEKINKKSSLGYRFLAGLIQALGATVGLALVLAILGYFISKIELIPIIGGWVSDIINQAMSGVNLPY